MGLVSYSHCLIVTLALFCIISEIKRYIGLKLQYPTFTRRPCRNTAMTFGVKKTLDGEKV